MKRFPDLFDVIDQSASTTVKVDALADYFEDAPEADRIWTIALLSGRRPKRVVTTTRLREWAAEAADIPLWLLEDSYSIVGDLAETICLVLPPATSGTDVGLSHWINELRRHSQSEEPERKAFVLNAWGSLDLTQRFIFTKLMAGGFRVGVSQKLISRALARATGKDEAEMAHRLMGAWDPASISWHSLIEADDPAANASRPYPFYFAYGLNGEPENLGDPKDWQAEWKWDGIRGQLIVRHDQHFVWSRDKELMTGCFPEFQRALDFIPDGTVLDGELLVWGDVAPRSFNALQNRIRRKSVPRKLLQDAPVILCAYDLLEWAGQDIRQTPLRERRATLETLCRSLPTDAPVRLSPTVNFDSWSALADIRGAAREAAAEGLMLKRKNSRYLSGRRKGDWWNWKLDALTIDAVMIYAQPGHNRHANLFTDLTFAVWNGNDLVPFTKTHAGLTDEEFRKVTAWVKKNTLRRFGPVRQVEPTHVFEIAFEGIQESTRHKSGVALRFPRMSRWRHDKPVREANTLDDLSEMLKTYG